VSTILDSPRGRKETLDVIALEKALDAPIHQKAAGLDLPVPLCTVSHIIRGIDPGDQPSTNT